VSGQDPHRRPPEGAGPDGPRPERAGAPWLAPAALLLAVAAAATLPGRPAGLGLALLGAGLCALGALGTPSGGWWSVAWWLVAAALACVAVVRSAAWVVVLCLLGATALASLAAAGGAGWRDVAAGLLGILRQLVPGPLEVGRRLSRATAPLARTRAGGVLPAVRGALLAAVLLAVFLPLFLAADAAFAQIATDALGLDLGVSQPVWRITLALLALAVAGALWRLGARRRERPRREPLFSLGRAEWIIALGTLDALFAAFVLVQVTTLFGGDDHVLRTAGLTYAEYARQGFAQLEVVAALTLAVIAAATRWGPSPDRTLRALLAVLCALTLVVLASALKRLGLYEHAYGFTRLRLLVHAQLLWLGALFVVLLAAGAVRRTAWLPRAIVAVSAAAALLFAAADPDRWVAQRNVDRLERTGTIDIPYLGELSPDAAPALDRLPDSLVECAAAPLRRQVAPADGLAGANLARARARRALARVPPDAVCS
jgi:hypothetical protein